MYIFIYVCLYIYIYAVHGSFLKADLFRRQDSSPHGQRCNQVPIFRIVRASFSNVFSNHWLVNILLIMVNIWLLYGYCMVNDGVVILIDGYDC